MNTGKSFLKPFQLFVFVVSVLAVTSCKDKKAFNQETAQSTVDLRSAVGEMDEVLKDINTVILEQHSLRGRFSSAGTVTTSVCGVKLDTTGQLKGQMTLNYNGTDCFGRVKTGKVSFTIEEYPLMKWKHKGCVLHIDFQSYKVQRTTDNKTVKLDGRQSLRNESGNSWFELWYMNSGPVTYVHTGQNMSVAYTGTHTAVFSVNRRLTYSYSSNVTACSVQGLAEQQGRGNVEAWGQGTDGNNMAAEVSAPYLWKTTCGAVAPVKGEVIVVVEGKEFELKCRYGVDASGNSVSESGPCPFGWETTWSRKKKTNSRLFGYY